ncbi:MAG: hypothetical protein KF729_00670 [Sandaracinaceae bacterium]|nr:hypothetical protein [Sandaracinaceae bacterium]
MRWTLLIAAASLSTACGASTTHQLSAYRIVDQTTDPRTGEIVYRGVAEDGSGGTVEIYAGPSAATAQRGHAASAPAFRAPPPHARAHRRPRWAMSHRFARRWRGHRHHRAPDADHRGPGCH